MPKSATLAATALAAFRAERLVFRDISFTLKPGGALILCGPNGAGKTTLLRLIAGFIPPAAGQLFWGDDEALGDLPLHAQRLSYLGHQDAIKPGLTVTENLAFAARDNPLVIPEAISALGLDRLTELPARFLSSGQKRRLALARLPLSRAPVWLLDEPANGLDAAALPRLGTLIADHRARGGLVIAATHIPLPIADPTTLALQ